MTDALDRNMSASNTFNTTEEKKAAARAVASLTGDAEATAEVLTMLGIDIKEVHHADVRADREGD